MKKIVWRILLLAIVAGAAVAGWKAWKTAHSRALPAGIVFGNGRIESIQVDVAAKYGGRIREIPAQEGDLVETGQVLARMDTGELEAELAKDKAKLAESREAARAVTAEITRRESEFELAEQEYNGSKNLFARKVVSREEFEQYQTRWETAKATRDGAKAKLKTAEQSIVAAAAQVKRTEVTLDDCVLRSPIKGRVLYRLGEPGETVSLGGKVLTLINLNEIYLEIFLPARDAARVGMGADARIVLGARPGYAARATVSFVSPEAQFTPKQVETRSERDKLMFRVKLRVPPEFVLPYIERIKTGVRGVGYVRLNDAVTWPDFLNEPFPKPAPG